MAKKMVMLTIKAWPYLFQSPVPMLLQNALIIEITYVINKSVSPPLTVLWMCALSVEGSAQLAFQKPGIALFT